MNRQTVLRAASSVVAAAALLPAAAWGQTKSVAVFNFQMKSDTP